MDYTKLDKFINDSGFFGKVMPNVYDAAKFFTAEHLFDLFSKDGKDLKNDLSFYGADCWYDFADRAAVLIQKWEDNRAVEIQQIVAREYIAADWPFKPNEGTAQFISQCIVERETDEEITKQIRASIEEEKLYSDC